MHDEKAALMAAFKPRPKIHVNVKKEKSFAVVRYTCFGEVRVLTTLPLTPLKRVTSVSFVSFVSSVRQRRKVRFNSTSFIYQRSFRIQDAPLLRLCRQSPITHVLERTSRSPGNAHADPLVHLLLCGMHSRRAALHVSIFHVTERGVGYARLHECATAPSVSVDAMPIF